MSSLPEAPRTSDPSLTQPLCGAQVPAWVGVLVLLAALLAPLAAVVSVPWFVTQDGPAHLYNAEIIARSFDANSPLRATYRVRWEPLPNWAGHALLGVLSTMVPPRLANIAINALTLAGFAASVLWLRWTVAGARGLGVAALFAVMLALNIAWLFGFTSFLLGACLFPLTLGVWWTGRDRLGPGRIAALAALLTIGYFCHPVSLGLTVLGLAILAAATSGDGRRIRAGRLLGTAVACLPLVPLGLCYLKLSRSGGGMSPQWGHLWSPFSPRAWVVQLSWADPISIAARNVLPFGVATTRFAVLLAPVVWFLAALALALAATVGARSARPSAAAGGRPAPDRRGWGVLAALLIAGGLIAPDTMGPNHGHYLSQRVVLLGLVALLPVLNLDPRRRAIRGCVGALLAALTLQSAQVWDYALVSGRTAGAFWRARAASGRGQRVAMLLVQPRGRSRANPLLHADCLLGLRTDHVIWGNYETRHYYFPVQFRDGIDRPDSGELEAISLQDDPRDAAIRAERWRRLLERYHDAIDVLVVWGSEPRLDAINAQWFRTAAQDGPLRILKRR